jgi:flagellar export protein FliJ
MNMTEQKKPVWQVLAAKAEKEVRQAQLVLAEMHQRKEQAQARDEKLEQLLVEYAAQLHAVQRRAHSTAEAGNYRQFIGQLQEIKNRAKNEISALELDCTDARKVLMAADRERLKLEKLAERAGQEQARASEQMENRATEAQSIIQYNLRQQPGRS